MRRRRILGVVMIVIGVMWLGGRFADERGERGWGRGDHSRIAAPAAPAAPTMPKFDLDNGWMDNHANFGRGLDNDWHGGHGWSGFWKLPFFLVAGALFFSMRRGRHGRHHRRDHGNTSTATIHRF